MLTIVIGVLIILPFLIPVRNYLNEAEKIASEKLGAPVIIGGGHLLLFPSPRVVVSDIVVGEQQDLLVKSLTVIPTISTLFSDTKIVDVKVNKPIVKKSALAILAVWQDKSNADKDIETGQFKIALKHIQVKELLLVWPNMQLPELDAEATMTDSHQLEEAVLETSDGKVKAEVIPKGDEQLVIITADNWTVPVGLPLLIDSAKVEGYLKDNKLTIPKINVALYGGNLTGDAVLDWRKNWRLSGKVKVDNLSVQKPSRLVSKAVYLSGNLFGNGVFSSDTKEAGALIDSLQANFKFNVSDGVLHGVDLLKVASLLTRQGKQGGETAFEEFSGVLNASGKHYHLRDLKISSGLIAAAGQVKVSPNKTLDGLVEVEVKRSVSLVAVPLAVSGTVSNPVLFPSKAALAGALAGTAILGPGVGTGLGVKAGGALDKFKDLFGSDK